MRAAAALVAVLALVSACNGSGPRAQAKQDLAPLRQAAALAPCPSGIGDVPHLTLPCLGGGPDVVLDSGPSGVPTLVNVYASWCPPCVDEMPLLAAFAAKAGGRVALLGVDTEDEPRLALLFARDVKQHWAAVQDDKGAFLRHYSSGPPVTLFVDRAGKVVFVHRGQFDSLADLAAAVQRRLGVTV
ncbi:MAG: TlpA family protein disulfide reductase [Actinomycetota bacterium]|nr:TlpA family protein disulfide reductase [Actinomycetota bacterium]